MMREIVDHQYSTDFVLHVHPTLNTAKGRERLGDCFGWDAAPLRHDERCHGVQDVMPPGGGQREFPKQHSMMRDLEPHGFAIDDEATRNPIITTIETVGFHRTESFFRRALQCLT